MMHRIRLAAQDGSIGMLSGEVEADETFTGARPATCALPSVNVASLAQAARTRLPVMEILERGGKVRTSIVSNRKRAALHAEVNKHVEAGSALYTDALLSYDGLASNYAHQVIVDGRIHTNGLENFWSLLKRGINGTCVSVEPFHQFRYLDEQTFRYNNRKGMGDQARFEMAMQNVADKR
jgi:transposase-like protein